MRSRLRRRFRAEDGFTLVEMVITVAIMGIIAAALVGIVFNYLRTTVDTQARLTESHDVQLASAYWQRDVASIGVRSNVYDTANHSFALVQSVGVTPCALPAGAAPVATLAWSEYTSLVSTDAPPTVKVTYAARQVGSVYDLLRVRCGSQPSTVQVADNLVELPELLCDKPCDGVGQAVPGVVKLKLRVQDSTGDNPVYTATLTGERRQT